MVFFLNILFFTQISFILSQKKYQLNQTIYFLDFNDKNGRTYLFYFNDSLEDKEINNLKVNDGENKTNMVDSEFFFLNESYDCISIFIDNNFIINNLNNSKRLGLYYISENESYLLANFYYYSSFQNFSNSNYIYSNELSINEKNSTLFQLKGSCNESFFNSVTLISQRVNFSATDFKISNCSEQNYTLNVTFNITSILNEKEEYNIIIEYNETKFEIINDIYTQIENTKIYGHQTIPILNCSGKNISNENQIECINCSSIKKYYSEKFKNLQECEPTEYFCKYLNECYSKCDLNNTICKYKYETNKTYIEDCEETNEDLKNSNEDNDCKCIYKNFEVDKINSNTEDTININWNENITLNITFKENFTNPLRIEITTEKDSIEYSSKSECNKITNESENIYNCTINMSDFSFFGDYNILYNITFKNGSDKEFNLTEKQNKKIKIKISEEYCDKSYQILNNNRQCEYCPDKQNYYNLNCHDNCSDDLYRFHNESINKYICLTKEECNNININNMTYKIEANKNGNYCLNECDNGYAIYNNNYNECKYCKEEEGFGSLNGKCEKCYEHNSIVADSGECVCDIGYEKKKDDKDLDYCSKCYFEEGLIEFNGKCECSKGLINIDNKCKLAENFYNNRTKIYCVNYNPCTNNNGICDDSREEIPICKCNNGFIGVYCETNISEINKDISFLEDNIRKMINKTNNIDIIQNSSITNNIKKISNLYLNLNSLNDFGDKIVEITVDVINNYNLAEINGDILNIIEFIGFSYYYQNKKLNGKLRRTENKLNDYDVINFYKNISSNQSIINNTKYFKSSSNGAFSILIFQNEENINNNYINYCLRNNIPYLSKEFKDSINYTLQIVRNENTNSENLSSINYFFFYDKNNNDITNNYDKYLTINSSLISISLYNKYLNDYYLERGINIYNKEDNAFNDECFTTRNFKYDLIPKFRQSLYQGQLYSENCNKTYLNYTDKLITFFCDKNVTEFYYYIKDKNNENIYLSNHRSGHLSLSCLSEVSNISKNIGFWIYFIVFLSGIFFVIMICLPENVSKSAYYEIMENDQLKVQTIKKQVNENKKVNEKKNIEDKSDNSLNNNNNIKTLIVFHLTTGEKGFIEILVFNFLHYHPILILSHNSILCSKWLNCLFFTFNISNLFGFNALFYSNHYLEKRIFKKNRNNFAYPISNEYGKISLAIFISCIILFCIKLLNNITYTEARGLGLSMEIEDNGTRFIKVNDDNKFYFKYFSSIFFLGVMFFFWIFSIGFCYIYPKAQITWFYSGIWCLILEWALFAPFFLFLLSFSEYLTSFFQWYHLYCIHYYAKRLFCF